MADWYPTSGYRTARTAHQPTGPLLGSGTYRATTCGVLFMTDYDRHEDERTHGDDGSVLWCTTCFPDAAPPGRTDGGVR